ncbi:unnamed protein product, partial [marine sediment metagenome]
YSSLRFFQEIDDRRDAEYGILYDLTFSSS